jgi:hypothetical protein
MDLAKGIICQPLPAIDDGQIKATAASDAAHDVVAIQTAENLRLGERKRLALAGSAMTACSSDGAPA